MRRKSVSKASGTNLIGSNPVSRPQKKLETNANTFAGSWARRLQLVASNARSKISTTFADLHQDEIGDNQAGVVGDRTVDEGKV